LDVGDDAVEDDGGIFVGSVMKARVQRPLRMRTGSKMRLGGGGNNVLNVGCLPNVRRQKYKVGLQISGKFRGHLLNFGGRVCV